MTTFKNLSFVLALALSATAMGCAADAPDAGGDNGGGGGGGSGSGGDDAPHSLDASGRYQMTSTFDLATNMPGTVGAVTNAFINMTDGATDPADWLLEQAINQTSGTVHDLLNTARPFVAGYLNDRLLQWAPDFVTTIVQVGNDFGQVARNFGINEQLDVTATGMAYVSTVTGTGVKFTIDQVATDISFADHNMSNIVVPNVGLTCDVTGKINISEHKLPLAYGQVLRLALDEVIIPMVDSNAHDLPSLLSDLVDCTSVGQAVDDAVYDYIGISGFANAYKTACTAGLTLGANFVYSKIDGIDSSALEFDLTGTAKGVDSNNDSKVDKIQTGAWTGTLSYAGTPAPLSTATFIGSRL